MIYLTAPLPSLSSLKVEMHSGATETLPEDEILVPFIGKGEIVSVGQENVGVGEHHGMIASWRLRTRFYYSVAKRLVYEHLRECITTKEQTYHVCGEPRVFREEILGE